MEHLRNSLKFLKYLNIHLTFIKFYTTGFKFSRLLISFKSESIRL